MAELDEKVAALSAADSETEAAAVSEDAVTDDLPSDV
jgi:hypothetical protein